MDEIKDFAEGDSEIGDLLDTSRETVASYIPFMSSVKFKSLPPVIEFGKDVTLATLASGETQEEAIDNLERKWAFNVLLPYAGNQVRKSLEGTEGVTGIDFPFVKNPTETAGGQNKV